MHGTIEDYKDIVTKFHKKEISYDEYKYLFEERYDNFISNKPTEITFANKEIISNV